ncbi:MAG: hypothetical protein HWD62_14320 [Cyclobacteriaceae bacterium]|nr:MAG: hypothetical protein HWD62_14320 [Cyclobacteriaceae bacterium]QOI96522.1 MAG: hypothetical protein HRU69_03040 [Flammeovirgaceae bacterium]
MGTGTVSFQANDKMDVFYVINLQEEGIEPSDEALIQVEDSQFDSDKAWVTGNVPMIKPVHVEGDTAIINAWFKGETFDDPFIITVYVECETAEELDEVIADEAIEQNKSEKKDFLEPMEIHL